MIYSSTNTFGTVAAKVIFDIRISTVIQNQPSTMAHHATMNDERLMKMAIASTQSQS
jgi:hypothetical protein